MAVYLWRLLLAAIIVVIAFAVIPLFCEVVGFTMSGALWKLIRVCIGGLAVLYVFRGGPPWSNA